MEGCGVMWWFVVDVKGVFRRVSTRACVHLHLFFFRARVVVGLWLTVPPRRGGGG